MFNSRWTKQLIFIFLSLVLIAWGRWFVEQKTIKFKNNQNNQPMLITYRMILNSSAFKRNDYLPAKYSCDGLNINPPLKITDIPDKAVSLVLIMNDPDAVGGQWTHWLLWNIPTTTKIISENTVPDSAIVGFNDFNKKKYDGPCPPASPKSPDEGGPSGTHHYVFELYALDVKLNLPADSDKNTVMGAMNGHIIAQTELAGLYSR